MNLGGGVAQQSAEQQVESQKPRSAPSWRVFGLMVIGVIVLWALFTRLDPNEEAGTDPGVGMTTAMNALISRESGEQKASVAGLYLAARYAQQQRDDVSAAERILYAYEQAPDDVILLQQTMSAALLAGHVEKALELAHRFETLLTEAKDHTQSKQGTQATASEAGELVLSPLARLLLIVEQMKQGQYGEVQEALELAIVDEEFTLFQRAFFTMIHAWAYVATGEKEQAFAHQPLLEKYADLQPFVQFHYGLMRAYLNQDSKAEKLFESAIDESATLPRRVVGRLGNFLQHSGQTEKAHALLDRFWQGNRDIWLEKREITEAITPYGDQWMIQNPAQGVAELLYGISSLSYQQGDMSMAYQFLHLALYLRKDFHIARILLASYLENEKRYQEAIEIYASIPENSAFAPRAKMEQAQLIAEEGDQAKAIKILKGMTKTYPQSPNPWLHWADLLRKQEKFEQAAEKYSEAIARFEEELAYQWPVYYMRGISHERSKQWEKAEKDFGKALALSPNNPDVLNYLAYSWVDRGEKYEEALKMLTTAVTARPYDAHIIDSVGWAYYKMGDYGKARQFIERAIELMPDDATVNDHLGDIYWQLGRKREARFQWERALLFDPDEELEAKLRQKLKHGLEPDESHR